MNLDLMAFFSRNNLPRIKDGAYVINLDDENSKGTHWVLSFINRNLAVYFDSFEIEYIPQKVFNKIKDKSITQNIFRIQDNQYVMCGFCCIAFIEYMLARKTLLDYTSLFSPFSHNSRTNYDIDMKFGPVTKLDKRIKTALKKFEDNVMSTNCDVIVISPIYGQFGAIPKPDSRRIVCKTYIFINCNLLSYKN